MALNTQIFQRTDDRENKARKSNSSKKTPHNYTQKKKPKTSSEQSNQNYYNFQTKQHQRKTLTNYKQNASITKSPKILES